MRNENCQKGDDCMLLWKRLTSFVLVLVLVAGMLPPIHVRAQETEETVLPEEILETVAPETEEILETVAPETEAPAAVELVPEESVPETTAPAETTEEADSGEILWIPGQADSEELYEGYLNRLFFGGVSPMGTLARDTLGDTDRYLYDRLKPVLLKIANGEQASAAATVDFSGSGYALADTNLNAVLDALYHDCPYEMYWYNGCYYSYWRNELRFWFQICKNFQVKGYDPYDPRIDTEKAGKAVTAAENAQAIVSRYYHYGDYEKLGAYADEICGLVRYNTGAANSNGWKNNINPWTLLNVFDGDSSTNVVCEGYAEAFQYLCDLSDFDGAVACFCPTGADHKWNIVRIGGASYLMDLTMGDEGSAMDRESFFLAGGKGSVETGYRIGGFHYWYYDTTKALWGTGEDSILKLSETSYDPATAPEADTITQDKFEAALENCGGSLELTRKLTVSRSLDLSGVALTVGAGGKITVAPGATLTVRQDASLTLTEGELLTATWTALWELPGVSAPGHCS